MLIFKKNLNVRKIKKIYLYSHFLIEESMDVLIKKDWLVNGALLALIWSEVGGRWLRQIELEKKIKNKSFTQNLPCYEHDKIEYKSYEKTNDMWSRKIYVLFNPSCMCIICKLIGLIVK